MSTSKWSRSRYLSTAEEYNLRDDGNTSSIMVCNAASIIPGKRLTATSG